MGPGCSVEITKAIQGKNRGPVESIPHSSCCPRRRARRTHLSLGMATPERPALAHPQTPTGGCPQSKSKLSATVSLSQVFLLYTFPKPVQLTHSSSRTPPKRLLVLWRMSSLSSSQHRLPLTNTHCSFHTFASALHVFLHLLRLKPETGSLSPGSVSHTRAEAFNEMAAAGTGFTIRGSENRSWHSTVNLGKTSTPLGCSAHTQSRPTTRRLEEAFCSLLGAKTVGKNQLSPVIILAEHLVSF